MDHGKRKSKARKRGCRHKSKGLPSGMNHKGAQVVKKRGIAVLKTKSAGGSISKYQNHRSAHRGNVRRRKDSRPARLATLTGHGQEEARTAQDQPM